MDKVKDNREEQRIEREAERFINDSGLFQHSPMWVNLATDSYIAGATKEAKRNKEDAIGFAMYCRNNYIYWGDYQKWYRLEEEKHPNKGKTTEQLYEMYLSKQK